MRYECDRASANPWRSISFTGRRGAARGAEGCMDSFGGNKLPFRWATSTGMSPA